MCDLWCVVPGRWQADHLVWEVSRGLEVMETKISYGSMNLGDGRGLQHIRPEEEANWEQLMTGFLEGPDNPIKAIQLLEVGTVSELKEIGKAFDLKGVDQQLDGTW